MLAFLNNATVAAFLGAFAAYLLVVFTDHRRRRRNRAIVKRLVMASQALAKRKLETVQNSLAMLREDGRMSDAAIMPFSTKALEDYSFQVLDILEVEEKLGIDVLVYWMTAIDSLLSEATSKASEAISLIKVPEARAMRNGVINEYIQRMSEAEKNLVFIEGLLGHYVASEPEKILNFKHRIDDA